MASSPAVWDHGHLVPTLPALWGPVLTATSCVERLPFALPPAHISGSAPLPAGAGDGGWVEGERQSQSWRDASLTPWPRSPCGWVCPSGEGRKMREEAMGGEKELLLPWEHVSEGTF